MTDSEKFIEEYYALCDKYNLVIEGVYPDMYAVIERTEYSGIHPISKEEWEEMGRNVQKEKRIRRKKKS